jgi:hypothetical protein
MNISERQSQYLYFMAQIINLVDSRFEIRTDEIQDVQPIHQCNNCGYQIMNNEDMYSDLMIESVVNCTDAFIINCPICGFKEPYRQ